MKRKDAESEFNYRIIKIMLATMLDKGIISFDEYESIRQDLLLKTKPLIGSLEQSDET